MDLCQPSVIKQLMEEAGIRFRKDFGQNFLINPAVPERIADSCADREDCMVLEIGPGIGCLTRELALRYEKVVAIEIDRGLLPVLAKTLADCPNAHVVNADVMKIDIPRLIKEEAEGRDVVVCANLPYYITTPILMRLLECGVPFRSITVMVQAEVATRLTAKAGESDYGAITAVLGYYGDVKRLFTVPAGCFMPAPKVNSAVIRIDLHKKCPYDVLDRSLFFGLIKAAFGQRRKTLVNAITSSYQSFSKDCVIKALNQLGFSETVRGERLSTSDFAALSDLLYEAKEGFSSK
ncbi:MAG: 16S rRNA (adenine(1518)-N(6)/adenine(1519)-N(6))-dimethyltransferase RsmA [Clostridia bacterium]|nr:16S rRNA (adenine(1518)-N(6)/adenine(1519)-N(6))-dimethyltransferase RsmA [Clostridia bacterium]